MVVKLVPLDIKVEEFKNHLLRKGPLLELFRLSLGSPLYEATESHTGISRHGFGLGGLSQNRIEYCASTANIYSA